MGMEIYSLYGSAWMATINPNFIFPATWILIFQELYLILPA